MSNFKDFGFGQGDEAISSGKFERAKFKEGETYRISFVWWPTTPDGKVDLAAPTPRFKGAKRFFIPGVGYVLDSGPEVAKIAGAPSKMTVASIIAMWPTNRKGELDKERFVRGDVEVKPWVFSGQIYENLARRHNEFHFGESDLSIKCTDTQYQKLDLASCKGNLYKTAMDTPKLSPLVEAIQASVKAIEEGIENLIGRDMTPAQLREKLGGASGGGSVGGGSVTTSDVDSMIDDLLGDAT
jgi:hypothetical protein